MILRRFMQHVKEQNWFAVGLDIVVVIVGIFLGMQVQQWYEEREFKSQERDYLSDVYEEVVYLSEDLELRKEFTNQVVESGKRALNYLDGDSSCEPECEDLLIDFFHASQFWATEHKQEKYNLALSLGFPTDELAKATVDDLHNYFRGWHAINQFSPPYRETVRSYFSADVFELLWVKCHVILSGGIEALIRDCKDDLASYDTTKILKAIHQDPTIRNELRFWVGQNLFAVKYNPTISKQATSTIQVLSDLLKNWND